LRVLIAWDWAQSPFLKAWSYAELSWAWLPLPFWVNGALLRVWMRPDLTPRLLSAALSALSVVLLWALWRKPWPQAVAVPAVIIAATVPWHLWLGGTATAQPLFHCLAVGALLAARSSRRFRLEGAGILLGLAAITRPEAWQLVLLWLMWLMAGTRRDAVRHRVISAVLACVFPAAWLLLWWLETGNPLVLLEAGASYQQLATRGAPAYLARIVQFPFVLVVTSPLVVTAALVGVVRRRRDLLTGDARWYAWFSLGFAATGFLAAAAGMGTTSAPQRYAVLPLVLLAPFAVHAVRSGPRRIVLVGVLAVLGLWGSMGVPRQYSSLWRLGRQIDRQLEEGRLPRDTVLCGEEAWDDATGTGTPAASPLLVCEEWGLAVASRQPTRVVCSRRGGFLNSGGRHSCRGLPYHELETASSRSPVLVITRRPGRPRRLPPGYELVSLCGPYRVWGPGSVREAFPGPTGCPGRGRFLEVDFGEGIALRNARWERGLLPARLYLCWRMVGEGAWEARPELRLTAGDGATSTVALGRFRELWPSHWDRGVAALSTEVHVPPGRHPGTYRAVVQVGGNPVEADLGAVVLAPSKRGLLLAFLRGEGVDWTAALKTLIRL
jgi:hypothetical protein